MGGCKTQYHIICLHGSFRVNFCILLTLMFRLHWTFLQKESLLSPTDPSKSAQPCSLLIVGTLKPIQPWTPLLKEGLPLRASLILSFFFFCNYLLIHITIQLQHWWMYTCGEASGSKREKVLYNEVREAVGDFLVVFWTKSYPEDM